MKLNKISVSAKILGIENTNSCVSHAVVSIDICDLQMRTVLPTDAYVLRSLTEIIPERRTSLSNWKHLEDLELADPRNFEPAQIDFVLGANVYAQIIKEEVEGVHSDLHWKMLLY